jgi:N-acetylmuramoyl-L-alanine amidase
MGVPGVRMARKRDTKIPRSCHSNSIASTVGQTPQLYCAGARLHPKSLSEMSFRTLLMIVVLGPVLLLGGAAALGLTIPVPHWGRDYVLRFAIADARPPLELPPVSGPDDPARPLVVIDAGHGGRDPGAVGTDGEGRTVSEKDITLAIALALRDELLEAGNIRVAMTRADDRIVPLPDRPEIARLLEADLFVSIHADSAGEREEVSGASIYTLSSEASSEAAARFAARENDADRLNGIAIDGQSEAVSAILVELSQQHTQDDAADFVRLLLREGGERLAFHPQPRRSAALAVLRAPDVPSVLFESGFVTNRADRARLTTADGRAQYARVLAQAIRIYFARRSDPAPSGE